VAARSKAKVCGRSSAEVVCSNAAGGMDVCLLEVLLPGINICDELITGLEVSCRQWCVLVCDVETSEIRKASPALGRSSERKKYILRSYRFKRVVILAYVVANFALANESILKSYFQDILYIITL
jgi:hypothetical protein